MYLLGILVFLCLVALILSEIHYRVKRSIKRMKKRKMKIRRQESVLAK